MEKIASRISENDIAEIVYTSGTTGFPRGVMLTHKNLLSNLSAVRKVIKIDSSFKLVSILPLFHMFEQMGGMLAPLSVGAQISHAASLSPNHRKRIFQDDKPNIMLTVPEFLRLIYLGIKEKAEKEGNAKPKKITESDTRSRNSFKTSPNSDRNSRDMRRQEAIELNPTR